MGPRCWKKDAYAQWNGSYVLSGQIQEKLYDVFTTGKTVSFDLDVQGLYSLKVSPDFSYTDRSFKRASPFFERVFQNENTQQ
jgi:hypothetical protein